MKVEMGERSVEQTFPRIMWVPEDGTVVLFHDEGQGSVLKAGSGPNALGVGKYCDLWNMDDFKDYEGTITLSHD